MKKKSLAVIAAAGAMAALLALAGCAPQSNSQKTATANAPAASSSSSGGSHTATLHRGYAAAHGDKAFTQVVVATAEDGTILGASIDDYQFMPSSTQGLTPVPNMAGLAASVTPDTVLISKTQNSAVYSQAMKEKNNATQEWAVSMQAIEKYAVGKKASDLASVSGVDAVSGATLVDTANYLKAVATVAQSNDLTTTGTYTGDGSDLKMGMTLSAAHGDKAFASAVALVQNGTVVAASVDDFQFMATSTANLVPVPNSDAGFGTYYVGDVKLASKSVNSAAYSQGMKTKNNAKQDWLTSMQAIEKYASGKTASELGSVSGVDAVSGATLVDTANYEKAIAEAVKAA